MSLAVLKAISEKRETFAEVNKHAITRLVPRIATNLGEIKGRSFNRSTIYRQVKRDDYPQPSWLESLFTFYAAVSFASQSRGEAITAEVASWDTWRRSLELAPNIAAVNDFWQMEGQVDALLAQVRRAHLAGDFYEKRALLIEIRKKVDLMLGAGMPEVIR